MKHFPQANIFSSKCCMEESYSYSIISEMSVIIWQYLVSLSQWLKMFNKFNDPCGDTSQQRSEDENKANSEDN